MEAGLLTINALVKESGLARGIIVAAMNSGALPCSRIGERRYVHRVAWKRFRKALAAGGINAAA
jgi:hypothetical protein